MSKLNVYIIRDEMTGASGELFTAYTDSQVCDMLKNTPITGLADTALRSIMDSVVYRLAEFDTDTLKVEPVGLPVLIARCSEYMRVKEGVEQDEKP